MKTFNERLDFFLKEQNITLNALSKNIDIAYSAIYKIKKNDKPTRFFLLLLEKNYHLSSTWLESGEGDMYLRSAEYSDPRQREVNEAYAFVPESGKAKIHEAARQQFEEEKARQVKQAEYERQHQEDVKKMLAAATVPQQLIDIPIAGYVQAGVPTWTEELHEGSLSWDRSRISAPENVFWLRIQGTSMIDCGMYPEDCILCDQGVEARKGDAVIAKVGDEMTVKEYRRVVKEGKAYVELRPCNEEFSTLTYPEEEVQIVAVVIANDWRLKRREEKTWRR